MGHDRDILDLGLTHNGAQNLLQRIAGIVGAFLVVIIVEYAGARWPGEDHRRNIRARIMHDLRKSIDGILKCVVEAMHEDHDPTALGEMRAYPARHFDIGLERRHADRGEIRLRIGRELLRPLHLAHLAVLLGGNGHHDIVERHELVALAGEKNAGIVRRAARGCNDELDLAYAGRSNFAYRHKHALRPAGTTRQKGKQDEQRRRCPRKNALQNQTPLNATPARLLHRNFGG